MKSSENRRHNKFGVAIAGVLWSLRTQQSFWIHLSITLAVVGIAAWLQVDSWRWAAIVLAITIVLSAELLNTSIEQLVKALHPKHDDQLGRALDVAAGAVLVAALGAVVLGLITLGPPLCIALGAPLWDALGAPLWDAVASLI